MGPHTLDKFFSPNSIAVFGASDRPQAVGTLVYQNLMSGDFKGSIFAINPKHQVVNGNPCFPTIQAIHESVDLAVIATPASTVPDVIKACGEHGVKAAIVLSAGFSESGAQGRELQKSMLDSAHRYNLHVIGPNCLGVMRPTIGLNATFSKNSALSGDIALVSQSGALCTAILDWATTQQVGFSAIVSLGDAADVDFGAILDFLALDIRTRSILLYVEGIRNARRFISGLRIASRMKPVIVVKAGRHAEGSKAATTHTGALVGIDDVFDAALRRAGAVRAMSIEQLFSAAEILASGYKLSGNRLVIITNGGGPGVMATDRAVELDVNIPELSSKTITRLNNVLPEQWSHGNPVDILGDASAQRYRTAVEACLEDDEVDGLLVMLTPQAMTKPLETADEVISAVGNKHKPTLACWMGEEHVRQAWQRFSSAKLPNFRTPEASVEAFSYLASHYRNQQLLLQVPSPLFYHSDPDVEGARLIIEGVLADKRRQLSALESKSLLRAFRIPVSQTLLAHNSEEALVLAEVIGFPLVMKINSPDISHKSDVGGIRLNISGAQAVRNTFNNLMSEVKERFPDAHLDGVTLEPMYTTPHGRELMAGILRDPVFGPVISFGAGGTTVEILQDRAVTLPPLNRFIVRQLIEQTRIHKLLTAFREMPAINMESLEDLLLKLSEIACELPHIQAMDINPIIADEDGVIAVDARCNVSLPTPTLERYGHMAVHPYPYDLVSHWQLPDGTDITIRPIRPEDAQIEQTFVRNLSPQSKYFRFMHGLQELTQEMLVRFTQIDYDREMALIAVTQEKMEQEIGVARYVINPDGKSCEFAIVVADAWHHRGLGSKLMAGLMKVAKAKGIYTMEGEVLATNSPMLDLVNALGFTICMSNEDPGIRVVSKSL